MLREHAGGEPEQPDRLGRLHRRTAVRHRVRVLTACGAAALVAGARPVIWIDGTTYPLPGLPDGWKGGISAIGADGKHTLVRSGETPGTIGW